MELVYLWVEKYKNIYHQGFNFSPEFDCKFDDKYDNEGKLSDDSKLEIKPKEYIKNFFDKKGKINITAIVGENGSGKSSVLELFSNIKYSGHLDTKYFFVVYLNKELILFCLDDIGKIYQQKETINKKKKKYTFTLNYDKKKLIKKITDFSNIFYSIFAIRQLSTERDDTIKSSIIGLSDRDTILSYKLNSIKNTIKMIKGKVNFERLFTLPTEINISVKENKPNTKDTILEAKINEIKKAKHNKLKFSEIIIINILYTIYEKNKKPIDKILEKKKYNDFEALKNDILEIEAIGTYKDLINNFLKKIEKIDNKYTKVFTIDISEISLDFMNAYYALTTEIFLYKFDILDFGWSYQLSSGQETFLFQFANFYNVLKEDDSDNFIIFIDEGETTMHPNWQKQYIQWYIKFLSNNFKSKKIHIIFTSHSPFLLSDLPKQNIIFLKDGKQVKGIEKKQTFGANIHTLLSDGFFMKDNLMGKFALDKIQKIVNFYNNVKDGSKKKEDYTKKIKKEFYFIRDNIGEEYIKGVITNHIEFIEEKLGDDDFIKRRKKQLTQELAELNKRLKNDTD